MRLAINYYQEGSCIIESSSFGTGTTTAWEWRDRQRVRDPDPLGPGPGSPFKLQTVLSTQASTLRPPARA
eukprot:3421244-Rhodomonas_salina.1